MTVPKTFQNVSIKWMTKTSHPVAFLITTRTGNITMPAGFSQCLNPVSTWHTHTLSRFFPGQQVVHQTSSAAAKFLRWTHGQQSSEAIWGHSGTITVACTLCGLREKSFVDTLGQVQWHPIVNTSYVTTLAQGKLRESSILRGPLCAAEEPGRTKFKRTSDVQACWTASVKPGQSVHSCLWN